MKRRTVRPRPKAGEGRLKQNGRSLAICLAVPLAVGAAAALLTMGGMGDYASMAKPPLSPPAWVFPVAWTALYLLMGLASWQITGANASEDQKQMALSLYAVQLAANFLWPLLFFGLGRYFLAFLWLLVLLLLVLLTWRQFRRLDRRAGALLVPYVLWLCFAVYLNLGVVVLN